MTNRLLLMPLAAGIWALAAAGAAAQDSPCGETYVMQAGDTLFQVTQQCRVTLDSLLSANPHVTDVRDIAIGTVLQMPGGDAPETGPGGQPPDEGISVQPLAGAPGAPIRVRGAGYAPGTTVTIGAGPPESEWAALEDVRVAADGTVEAYVDIPDSARPGGQIVMVIDTPQGETNVSQPIDVVAERDPDVPDGDGGSVPFTTEGRISQGVECPILTTPDGLVYGLAGRENFPQGAYVEVSGELFQLSTCMQGEGTIAVESLDPVAPPAG